MGIATAAHDPSVAEDGDTSPCCRRGRKWKGKPRKRLMKGPSLRSG